ncbi:MAG: cytochrome c [Ardenticatenaceae bacterium]|nr:cytochrome c [Ardenticatenaceae bacterium]
MKQIFLILLLSVILGATACGANPDTTAVVVSTSPTEQGAVSAVQSNTTNRDSLSLYAQNCAACHGPTGAGTTVAPPLNSAELRTRLDAAAIRATISNGRPGTAMPVWGNILSAAQIDALVELIRNWPELDEASLAQLQEEMAKTTAGPGMMAQDMMGPGMMNSHMDWQVEATPGPGENPTWGHHGGNGGHGQWQGDTCCGWGMMGPGN